MGGLVQLWFWGWLVVAASTALLAAITRDRTAAPFALGAGVAALIEATLGQPAWEWVAFAAMSFVTFVALNRRRYHKKHAHDPKGRHSHSHPHEAD